MQLDNQLYNNTNNTTLFYLQLDSITISYNLY